MRARERARNGNILMHNAKTTTQTKEEVAYSKIFFLANVHNNIEFNKEKKERKASRQHR